MQEQVKLPFITLLLLISFASVNAVLFTPALPNIASFYTISATTAQQTIIWFLIGYSIGQLLYGPIANRFGRKPALYAGISLQILSSLFCAFAGTIQEFGLLVIARFMLAIGSGVGLKMTFTLVNESYEPKVASQKISYLLLAFAITPGLGIAIGGILNKYFGWTSCFYAGALYGLILLFLTIRLPETQTTLNLDALKIKHLLQEYKNQFKNTQLIYGGLLMGCSTCFVYAFATIAPFISINLFGMTSAEYGLTNILPALGMIMGSLVSAQLPNKYSLEAIIKAGIGIIGLGVILMLVLMLLHLAILFSLFLPMIIIFFGLCFILANASTIAMSNATDKAHGAAVMSFINMGLATIAVFLISFFPINTLLLPSVFLVFYFIMLRIFNSLCYK